MSEAGTKIAAIIAGAGLMGRWHAHACSRAGGSVVACADPDLGAAEELAARFGGRPFSSLSEALDAVDAQVVHVCSPLETHEAMASASLRRGRHVLVEKPVTPDAEGTERLLAEAERSGVHLVPVHQFLFQPGVRKILETRDRWGPLRHLLAVACSAGASGEDAAARSRVALDIVPHFLSLVGSLHPVALTEGRWSAAQPYPGELHVGVEADGVSAALTVSMNGRPTRNTLDVIGENGSAQADLFHGYATFEAPGVSRSRKMLRPFDLSARTMLRAAANLASRAGRREPAYPGLRELVARVYRSVLEDSPPPIPPADTVAVARARDRIRRLLQGESS